MKRWQILVVVAAVVIGILTAGGTVLYKYYIVPTYLEPVVNQISEYLQDDEVVEELYDQALRLHDEGVMDDETYDNFVEAYRSRMKKVASMNGMSEKEYKKEEARAILESKDAVEGQITNDSNSLSARYASSKVGVELVQVNEDDTSGSAAKRYSTERTSERIKAEDFIEAEKIIAGEEVKESEEEDKSESKEDEKDETKDEAEEPKEDLVSSAYAKLKANMSADEYSDFVSIMGKLDVNTLKSYMSDKKGLKEYIKSRLSEEEYKRVVNLGYKYMNLFIEE